MNALFRAWMRAWRGVRQSPGLFASTVIAVLLAVFLIGALVLTERRVSAWLDDLIGSAGFVVYLLPDRAEADAERIKARLEAMPEVARVSIESKDAAAKRIQSVLSLSQDALSEVLTWSLYVKVRDNGALEKVASLAHAQEGVDAVDLGEALSDRLHGFERGLMLISTLFSIIVALACVFVVHVTTSLSLAVRKDEIQVQKIVGASDAFVVVPLMLEGAWAGLLGASLALIGLRAIEGVVMARIATLLQNTADVRIDQGSAMLLLFAFGMAAPTLGAAFASIRWLRRTE